MTQLIVKRSVPVVIGLIDQREDYRIRSIMLRSLFLGKRAIDQSLRTGLRSKPINIVSEEHDPRSEDVCYRLIFVKKN